MAGSTLDRRMELIAVAGAKKSAQAVTAPCPDKRAAEVLGLLRWLLSYQNFDTEEIGQIKHCETFDKNPRKPAMFTTLLIWRAANVRSNQNW